MNKLREIRQFDPAVRDTFHQMVKDGGSMTMNNGHVPRSRRIERTLMPPLGSWLPPSELCEVFKEARWVELT